MGREMPSSLEKNHLLTISPGCLKKIDLKFCKKISYLDNFNYKTHPKIDLITIIIIYMISDIYCTHDPFNSAQVSRSHQTYNSLL